MNSSDHSDHTEAQSLETQIPASERSERVLRLGNDINTDDIIPAKRGTNADPEYLKWYALEHIVGMGKLLEYDVIEAGTNFGCGSSREFAPIALKAAGIREVRAQSFAEIFYRNSINIGLPLKFLDQQPCHPIVAAITAAGGLFAFNQQRLQGRLEIPTGSPVTTSVSTSPSSPASPSSAASPTVQATRPMTLAEKLLARASGHAEVQPGDVVFAQVDLAMSHDAIAGPVAQQFYQQFGAGARVWNADRLVLVADHFIQINDIRADPKATLMYHQMVEFAREQGCHLLDIVSPGEAAGICHVLLPEQGFVRPGMVIVGTDSHSCTYGAFGCFSTGIGTTDMANLLATGDLWIRVPATIRIELSGSLPTDLSAKDIMLFLLGQLGGDGALGRVIEFSGTVIDQLPMDERMTLANMAIECGAICGLITPDTLTCAYSRDRLSPIQSNPSFEIVTSDPGAEYERVYSFDLSCLEPQVACPPKPDQVVSIRHLAEIPIDKAFIGSCTGGKLWDLAAAAKVLQGRRVAPQVSLFIVPASQTVLEQAQQLGYLEILTQAGAVVLKSGCGACINAGKGVLAAGETGIYATNRNFKGRSGDPTGQNYLASPRIVAISAIQGKISDRLED